MEPKIRRIDYEFIANQLAIWKHNGVSDAYATKLLKLWLGKQFKNLMNDKGIFEEKHFNIIRKALGFSSMAEMLKAIESCFSFYILGDPNKIIRGIASPIWHDYDPREDILVEGSIPKGPEKEALEAAKNKKQNIRQNSDSSIIENNIIRTTVSDAERQIASLSLASTPEESEDEVTIEGAEDKPKNSKLNLTNAERRKIARSYFHWITEQTDRDHQIIMAIMRHNIKYRKDINGNVITYYSDEDTEGVLKVMLSDTLVTSFSRFDRFFMPCFMDNPASRRFWIKNDLRLHFSGYLRRAEKKYKKIKAERIRKAEMANRPISPYEWMDSEGNRFYEDKEDNHNYHITKDAPPRPSETAWYYYPKEEWREPQKP